MKQWLAARWQGFLGSFDPEETTAGSSPVSSIGAVGALVVVYLAIGEIPWLRRMSDARATWPCILLTLVGGCFTHIAYRRRCRGTLGALSTLLDNGCYAASLSLAALRTSGGFAIGFAIVHVLMLMAFPASFYGFSLLMASVLSLPTLLMVLWYRPDVPVTLVLVASSVMTAIMMVHTQKRRELLEGAKRLQRALGATDQMLDVAMQRALTTTLLNLGNFLHELRNVQTAVRMNLEFLDRDQLNAEQLAAVSDALQAARSEQGLLEETLEELRRQAQPREGSVMIVGDVLERTLHGRVAGLRLDYRNEAPRFEVRGEPAHLATVIRNLLRNARQAGASRAEVRVELEPSARSISISVQDDGPGIAPDKLRQLFQPFVTEGKPTGTGLGLYLCRRYIELMQGDIHVQSKPGEGARFSIRLPGTILVEQSAPATAAAQPA